MSDLAGHNCHGIIFTEGTIKRFYDEYTFSRKINTYPYKGGISVNNTIGHGYSPYLHSNKLLIFAVLALAYQAEGMRRRQGFLAGIFLVLVFAARFALEFFKTPQAAYEAGFSLTVGQWLSVPCILAGLWIVATARLGVEQARITGRK